jgi:hypothetical protein
MNGTPSFHRVDYSIRTNKHIERRLVFDQLKRMEAAFSLPNYRYLGLGSMWFVDFILAHRILGISNMWSIEHKEEADRAEFNKPYDCIEIKRGLVSAVLDAMNPVDWSVPSVAWLDYDGRFDDDVRANCERYLRKAAVGSVVVISVNAHRNSYRPGVGTDKEPSVKTLRDLLGDAVPTNAGLGKPDVSLQEFPALLSRSLLNYMSGVVRGSGRETEQMPDRFVPLFDLYHEDNAPMVTVGGIVVSWKQLAELEKLFELDVPRLFSGDAAARDVLDLIPLTMKEKMALDRLLPCGAEEFAQRIALSGVRVMQEQADKYRRLYTRFPVFAETMV